MELPAAAGAFRLGQSQMTAKRQFRDHLELELQGRCRPLWGPRHPLQAQGGLSTHQPRRLLRPTLLVRPGAVRVTFRHAQGCMVVSHHLPLAAGGMEHISWRNASRFASLSIITGSHAAVDTRLFTEDGSGRHRQMPKFVKNHPLLPKDINRRYCAAKLGIGIACPVARSLLNPNHA